MDSEQVNKDLNNKNIRPANEKIIDWNWLRSYYNNNRMWCCSTFLGTGAVAILAIIVGLYLYVPESGICVN